MHRRSRITQHGRARLALAALLGAGVAAGLVTLVLNQPEPAPAQATVLPEPLPLPAFRLADHERAPFTRESFRNRWSLVFFGFTNCPDICPATLQKLAMARRRLARQMPAERLPDIVFISVDPMRDGTDAVAAYAGAFGDGVIGVTGELQELDKLTAPLGIYHGRIETDGGEYTVEHSSAVLVINENAELHAIFGAPHDADVIASDMALIAGRP